MYHLHYTLPVMIIFPLISLTQSNHFLSCLLNLEAMTLSLILLSLILLFKHTSAEPFNCLMILSMGACEASLGLSCLIKMIRKYGNDQTKMLNSQYF